VVFLTAGHSAINSVFDKDEGDIGYLNAPPALRGTCCTSAWFLLVAGHYWRSPLPLGFQIAYAICFVLSILYSVAVRFRRWPVWIGSSTCGAFGTLTPYAPGPRPAGRSMRDTRWCCSRLPLFAGLYPLTQFLYQFEEDQRRGDRTLALILGMR